MLKDDYKRQQTDSGKASDIKGFERVDGWVYYVRTTQTR